MEKDLAIITSGGGSKCSFGAGVMLALKDKFGIEEPSTIIAASASSGTGAYFVSQQYDSIRNIWTHLLSSKRLVNPLRFWKIADVDYLVDEILKKQDPLDSDKVYSSDTHLLIPAVNRQTGNIDYFSNKDGDDIFQAMKATQAAIFAYSLDPHIPVNGNTYCDSWVSSCVETHFDKAVKEGAKKIIAINHPVQTKAGDLGSKVTDLWMYFQDDNVRMNYNKARKQGQEYQFPSDVDMLLIEPKEYNPLTIVNTDEKLIKESIEQGYKETMNNTELERFLDNSKTLIFPGWSSVAMRSKPVNNVMESDPYKIAN